MAATGSAGDRPRPSLRVRKAERAKQHASDVARRLIRERGYDNTSLDDIADAAETSVSTLLRYFGSKERLALAQQVGAFEGFREAVTADGPTSTLERWRTFVGTWAAERAPFSGWEEDRDLIAKVPAVHRLNSHLQRSYQDLLAESFAREAGVDPEHDLYGQLLAALLIAGNEAVFRRWLATGGERDLVETCLEVVDFAEDRLGARDDIPRAVFRAASPA